MLTTLKSLIAAYINKGRFKSYVRNTLSTMPPFDPDEERTDLTPEEIQWIDEVIGEINS